jgi:ribonuclease BN (tRNA processing enzyme)
LQFLDHALIQAKHLAETDYLLHNSKRENKLRGGMRLEVLGCSGGIGQGYRTTALRVDQDILIDGGTGLGDLSLAELARIDHIFITHAHLDHIACIPLLLDSVGHMRDKPLIVHGSEATLDVLRKHIFNWEIWPDFSCLPNSTQPFMRYHPIDIGIPVELNGRKITALPAEHVVPAVGYHLDSGLGSLVFTGDTTSHDILWEHVNRIENLRYLLIESAFAEQDHDIAVAAKHLCPSMLGTELRKLQRPAEIFVTHLKPGSGAATMQEIQALVGLGKLSELQIGHRFDF